MINISISPKDYQYIEKLDNETKFYLRNLGISIYLDHSYGMRISNTERPDLWGMIGIKRCISLYKGLRHNSYSIVTTRSSSIKGVTSQMSHIYFKIGSFGKLRDLVESLASLSQYEYATSDFLNVFSLSKNGRKSVLLALANGSFSIDKDWMIEGKDTDILAMEGNNQIILKLFSGIIYANCVDLLITINFLNVPEDPYCLEVRNKTMTLTMTYVSSLTGELYERQKLERQLIRMGYTIGESKNKDVIRTEIPIYRKDLLRNEIIADILLDQTLIPKPGSSTAFSFQKSTTDPWINFIIEIKKFITNQGFQEYINQLLMEGKELVDHQKHASGLAFRKELLHQLLKIEDTTQRKPLPHNLFEIGPVAKLKENTEIEENLAVVCFDAKVNISNFIELINLLGKALGKEIIIEKKQYCGSTFIDGRFAELLLDNKYIGYLGEFHPRYLYENKIKSPGIYAELSLTKVYEILNEKFFTIHGGKALKGTVQVSGSKNASLPIIFTAAALPIKSILKNVPTELQDVQIALSLLSKLGVSIKTDTKKGMVEIVGPIKTGNLLYEDIGLIRSSLLLMSLGLSKFRKVIFPTKVGGCDIGERKYDQHLAAFQQMGVNISYEEDSISLERTKLRGGTITFSIQSTSATENALILSMFADGAVTMNNVHLRPEILDQIKFMKKAGIKCKINRQNNSICIKPAQRFNTSIIKHTIMGDLDEAFTFIVATQLTGGIADIRGFSPAYLREELNLLSKIHLDIKEGKDNILCKSVNPQTLLPFNIEIGAYPAIGSDRNPILAILATSIKGSSFIQDGRFPERTKYLEQIDKVGIQIEHKDITTVIKGGIPTNVQDQQFLATDLRGGIACLILALTLDCNTTITNIIQIDRGFDGIERKLSALGATITRNKHSYSNLSI